MKIIIGEKFFNVTLTPNKSSEFLQSLLPLTLNMEDYNSNEKKFDFTTPFPTAIETIDTIYEGDILLWGDRTLVLFYKTFNTPYRYTRIGKVDDPSGLSKAVGIKNVLVLMK